MRGYVFAGVIIGGLLYTKSFSGFLVKYISIVLNKIITLVLKKPAKAVKLVIMKPVRYLKKGIKRVYGRLGKKKEE